MESIVSCGYIVLRTLPVAKAMTNSILEFCDDVKHRKEDIVESTLLFPSRT